MYREITQAALQGKPAAVKAARLIRTTESFMIKVARDSGTPIDESVLSESLAQLCAYSNPWLEVEAKLVNK